MFFELKKILSALLSPSFLIFFGLCAGMVCLVSGRRIRRAATWFLFSLLLVIFCFFSWVPGTLINHLESQYPPFSLAEEAPGPGWIVVLGQGVKNGPLPETARINGTMYVRLMEAVRIARLAESARIIVSLSGEESAACKTGWWDFFCTTVCLPAAGSVVLTEPVDTEAEIRNALEILGHEPFILVTSALHMPRAMRIAGSLGGNATAAPCGFGGLPSGPGYRRILPSSHHLRRTEKALHEIQGLLWWWIKEMAGRRRTEDCGP